MGEDGAVTGINLSLNDKLRVKDQHWYYCGVHTDATLLIAQVRSMPTISSANNMSGRPVLGYSTSTALKRKNAITGRLLLRSLQKILTDAELDSAMSRFDMKLDGQYSGGFDGARLSKTTSRWNSR